jgi:hypothetical protein
VATQASIEYYLALDRSDRPRTYLFGPSPDDERELWYFEAVEDNGVLVAIRQLTIGADGTRHAYSPQHVEDAWGFLTDQPIDYADELTPCDAEQFRQIWEPDRQAHRQIRRHRNAPRRQIGIPDHGLSIGVDSAR